MKYLLLLAFVAAASASCQTDFDKLTADNQASLAQINTGQSQSQSLCMVENSYISQLRVLLVRPDCNTIKPQIQNTRRKTEEFMNQNASACVHCTTEVDSCLNSAVSAATNPNCSGRLVIATCLHKVDNKPECANEKQRIQDFITKLNKECSGSASCQTEFDTLTADNWKSLAQIKTGGNQSLCMVENSYISQLWVLLDRPDCNTIRSQIQETRRKTEEFMNQNASACVHCTTEVDDCLNSAATNPNCSGRRVTATCLQKADNKPECANEKKRIQDFITKLNKECSGADRLRVVSSFLVLLMLAVTAMLK